MGLRMQTRVARYSTEMVRPSFQSREEHHLELIRGKPGLKSQHLLHLWKLWKNLSGL